MNPQGSPPAAPPLYSEVVRGFNPATPSIPLPKNVPVQIVTTVVPVGPDSTHTVCPHCHAEIDTVVRKEPGLIAWISGGLLALAGCWLGCCLIPCCTPECMNVHHSCPNCKAYLGRYNNY